MGSYILRRLLQAIPIVIGISVVSFLIVHLTPGSPVDKFRTPRVSPETINNLIRLYGLDQPLPTQFVKWFTHFWTFPFDNTAWGYSFTDGLPVRDKIFARIPSTLWLTGVSLLVTVIIAVPIGVLQAIRQYSWSDKIITTFETIGYAMPTFWLGLMLKQTFSVQLNLFPLFGENSFGKNGDILDLLWHLALPVTTLAIIQIAGWSRYMRASMLEVLRQDGKNVPALSSLATLQLERNQLPDAERHFKQALALAPADSGILLNFGRLQFQQKKYDEALDALNGAAKLDPKDAKVQEAWIAYHAGDFENAAELGLNAGAAGYHTAISDRELVDRAGVADGK